MGGTGPAAELDTRFSDEHAAATDWKEARRRLEAAEIYWVTTVRPDGRPHTTPLIAVWLEDAMYFCTGPTEQKAHNLVDNPHCILATGCSTYSEGLDLVVEGDAVQVRDDALLRRLSDLWVSKYGSDWRFEVRDGAFWHGPGEARVYRVAPAKVLAFGRGDPFSQTRWRF